MTPLRWCLRPPETTITKINNNSKRICQVVMYKTLWAVRPGTTPYKNILIPFILIQILWGMFQQFWQRSGNCLFCNKLAHKLNLWEKPKTFYFVGSNKYLITHAVSTSTNIPQPWHTCQLRGATERWGECPRLYTSSLTSYISLWVPPSHDD